MADSQQPDKGVWISKEEYERLRQTESRPGSVVMPAGSTQPAPIDLPGAAAVAKPTQRGLLAYEIGGAIMAIIVYLSFVIPDFQGMGIIGGLGLTLLAGFGLRDMLRARAAATMSTGQAAQTSSSSMSKTLKILGIVAILVVCGPVILQVLMIGFLLVICSFGGCRGS